MSSKQYLLPLILLAAACGEFIPNPIGPGSPGGGEGGGGGGGTDPEFAIPFRIGGLDLDEGRAVAVVADGVVLASWFTGTVDFDPSGGTTLRNSLGSQDVAIAKYDETGEFRWVYTVGSVGSEVPNGMAATPDGGVIVVGHGTGGVCAGQTLVGQGGRDILMVKMGPTGNCEWAQLVGGDADDEARAVAVDSDGTILVVGLFRGSVDFDRTGGTLILQSRGSSDAFLARFTADGFLIDAVQAGGPEDDQFDGVDVGTDQDVTAVGTMRGTATFGSTLAPVLLVSAGGADGSVARYSQFFGLRWANRVGGSGEDRATAVATNASGNPVVVGTFEGTADLDPSGGAALVVSRGLADIFMVRFGALTGDWDGLADAVGGPGGEGATSVAVDLDGSVLVGGWFQETVDFDPGAGTSFKVARGTSGSGDAFLASWSPGFGLNWVVPIGGIVAGDQNLSNLNDLALDPAGTVWVTGRFFGLSDFDPLDGAVELTPAAKSDAFLSRYRAQTGEIVVTEYPEAPSP